VSGTVQKVNLSEKLARFQELWTPKVVGAVNDFHVKLVKLKGEFVWHSHEAEDELFLVLRGTLRMQFRDHEVAVEPGELIVVGSNCSGDGVRNIQAGKMYATNYAPPGPEAAEVANSVAGYFNGKAPPKEKYLRAFSLTKENVDKYAKVCGF